MSVSSITPMQVFCIPQPGKPDPNADYTLGNARPRVPQSPQKGDTCWYYAMILAGRERYGKTASDLAGRVVEMELSAFRKKISELTLGDTEAKIEFIRQFIQLSGLPTFTTTAVGDYLKEKESMLLSRGGTNILLVAALKEFCAQTEIVQLQDYAKFLKRQSFLARAPIYEEYLKSRNINLAEAVDECLQSVCRAEASVRIAEFLQRQGIRVISSVREKLIDAELASIKLSPLNPPSYTAALSRLAVDDIRKRLGFKMASWDPSQPIDALIQSLQEHGPHCVSGEFGASFFLEPPVRLKDRIEGRLVYGWKKGVNHIEMNPENCDGHEIVVVGATKDPDGSEFVFFLDPTDGNDPNDLASQCIYKLTFGAFTRFIKSANGFLGLLVVNHATGTAEFRKYNNHIPAAETGLHYAYYLDSKKDS